MTKKEAYVKKIQAQLDVWDAQLDLIKAQLVKAGADANIKLNEQLENLEEQRSWLSAQLDRLELAGDEAWEDIQKGVEEAWDTATKAFNKAAERFK